MRRTIPLFILAVTGCSPAASRKPQMPTTLRVDAAAAAPTGSQRSQRSVNVEAPPQNVHELVRSVVKAELAEASGAPRFELERVRVVELSDGCSVRVELMLLSPDGALLGEAKGGSTSTGGEGRCARAARAAAAVVVRSVRNSFPD